MSLLVKDANQATQSLSTQSDSASNLAPVHVPAAVVAGVATPVAATAPLPVMNTAADAAGGGNATITTGGSAQLVNGGVVPVNGFSIQNTDAAEDLWVNDVGTAGIDAGFKVVAGAIYATPSGYKPGGAVSVYAATTGHKFVHRHW